MFSILLPILDGDSNIHEIEHKDHLNKIARTHDKYLTAYGKSMKEQVKHLIKWRNTTVPKDLVSSNSFLNNAHSESSAI